MQSVNPSKISSVVAIVALAFAGVFGAGAVAPASAVETTTIVNGVIYRVDGAGAAYASGYNNSRPAYLSIESSVNIGGSVYPVTAIGTEAFAYASTLVSVTLPDSVMSIGKYAFGSDPSLSSVTFGNGLTSIGESAFAAATSLVSVTIPDSVTTIGYGAFYVATSLRTVVVGSHVTSIDSFGFAGTRSLVSVTFRGAAPSVTSDIFYDSTPTIYYFARYAAGYTSDWNSRPAVAIDEPLSSTPTPTISGSATVGETISATAGSWDSGVSLNYQWSRDGVAILGATSSTVQLTLDDFGHNLTVAVTGTKSGFTTVTKTSSATSAVGAGTLSPTPTPTITGTASVGETLTASAGSWASGTALTYQWRRDGVDIAGATDSTYSLVVADLATQIGVKVTATKLGYQTETRSSDTQTVADGTLVGPDSASVVLDVAIGKSISVNPGTWDSAVNVQIQWYRNDTVIVGETGATYTLKSADFGQSISALVTGTRDGYANLSIRTASVLAAAGSLVLTPTPTTTGTLKVGSKISAVTGVWDDGVSFTYQWFRNGASIAGATGVDYVLSRDDFDALISVSVTGSRFDASGSTQVSDGGLVLAGLYPNAPTATISGTAKVGDSLTAGEGAWSSTPSFSYQWLRNGSAISGATSKNYLVTPADVGQDLTVRVKAQITGYEDSTSVSTKVVGVLGLLPQITKPQVAGTFAVGNSLTASVLNWDNGATVSYQWLRNGVAVSGATASSYAITASDYDAVISVQATGSKSGYASTSASSTAVMVTLGTLQAVSGPVLQVPAQVGKTLSVSTGQWTTGAILSYQWFRAGSAITGAQGSSYVLTAEDLGKSITYVVTGSKAGYLQKSLSSLAVVVQAGVLKAASPTVSGVGNVGKTLTINPGVWDAGVQLKYQWLRNGKTIAGATAKTRKLTKADLKSLITVKVFATKNGYLPAATASRTPVKVVK